MAKPEKEKIYSNIFLTNSKKTKSYQARKNSNNLKNINYLSSYR